MSTNRNLQATEPQRLTATKKAIEAFRNDHPQFTDAHLASSVQAKYPNLYENNMEVAIEIVKELYRRQKEWTDESFSSLLQEMTEGRKLVRFETKVRKQAQIFEKVNPFIERLYHEAQRKTIFFVRMP